MVVNDPYDCVPQCQSVCLWVYFTAAYLSSIQKPLWQDLVCLDIRSQWKENCKLAQMVNFSLVDDPTIHQPGFNLLRQQWSLLNHCQTAQGHCGACKKWNEAATDLYPCGEIQTMCPLTTLIAAYLNYTLLKMKPLLG